jgi:hypothetical protein
MIKKNTNRTLLAARVEPWQLFRFKKFVEWRKSRPGIVLQEALQVYLSKKIPAGLLNKWLDEYHNQESKKS